MQNRKDRRKSCQIFSFEEARRKRDERKEAESLTDFEITEEDNEAERRLLKILFPDFPE